MGLRLLYLPIFGTPDIATVTTFVTGTRLHAADGQKAAESDAGFGRLLAIHPLALRGVHRRLCALRRLSEGCGFTESAL
jgi:hypothetical protein